MIEKVEKINQVRGFLSDRDIDKVFSLSKIGTNGELSLFIRNDRAGSDKALFLEFYSPEELDVFLSTIKRAAIKLLENC